ncbi:MAG: hypothetical protein Q9165_008786 [Trypethelium subeluteriae]
MANETRHSEDDEALFVEKQSRYRGRAKVKLHDLMFEPETVQGARTLDWSNVQRLVHIFQTEGCHRLETEHFVPVVLSLDQLVRARGNAGVAEDELLIRTRVPPLLCFDRPLLCLHGRHRIEAARRFLTPVDSWWGVEFYLEELSEKLILQLRSEDANSHAFSDGDIYRHLRFYQLNHDDVQAQSWLARLSRRKQVDVGLLASKLTPVYNALDRLLPFVGLWGAVQLGTLHRILSLRCEEELCYYLNRVYDLWAKVMPAGCEAKLDVGSVHRLELLAPRYSREDSKSIVDGIQDGRLLTSIPDPAQRTRIQASLLEVEGRILSLYTFFEDTKYLEPCAQILRSLLPKTKESTQAGFRRMYRPSSERLAIQVTEYSASSITASHHITFDLAYQQLWLFAMRHFPEMTAVNPRKDARAPNPAVEVRNDLFAQFGQLAYESGFESTGTSRRRQSVAQMIYKLIGQVRPDDFYNVDQSALASHVQNISCFIEAIPSRLVARRSPPLTSRVLEEPVSHRCGRPYEQSHNRDRGYLFLENICNNRSEAGVHVSSFAIKRDLFRSFFELTPATTSACEPLFNCSTVTVVPRNVSDFNTASPLREPQPSTVPTETDLPLNSISSNPASPPREPQPQEVDNPTEADVPRNANVSSPAPSSREPPSQEEETLPIVSSSWMVSLSSSEVPRKFPHGENVPFQLRPGSRPCIPTGERILYVLGYRYIYRFHSTQALESIVHHFNQQNFFIGTFFTTGFQAVLPHEVSRYTGLLIVGEKFHSRPSFVSSETVQDIRSFLPIYHEDIDHQQALSGWPFTREFRPTN